MKFPLRSWIFAMAICLLSHSAHSFAAEDLPFGNLKPFETDGCTLFPDGTPENPTLWQHCCVAHDFLYWRGGSFEERKNADLGLYQCVKETGHEVIANAMYYGVRGGGNPWVKTYWRWGYGWEHLRGYSQLSPQEAALAREMAPLDLSRVPISRKTAPGIATEIPAEEAISPASSSPEN